MKYSIQIFIGSADECIFSAESDTPFMTISKGDLLDPTGWNIGRYDQRFLAEKLTHQIVMNGPVCIRHQILIHVTVSPLQA